MSFVAVAIVPQPGVAHLPAQSRITACVAAPPLSNTLKTHSWKQTISPLLWGPPKPQGFSGLVAMQRRHSSQQFCSTHS